MYNVVNNNIVKRCDCALIWVDKKLSENVIALFWRSRLIHFYLVDLFSNREISTVVHIYIVHKLVLVKPFLFVYLGDIA